MAKYASGTQERQKTDGTAARPSGGRSVTMEAVGRLAGVSQVTVSRALSDPSKVSPATLEKIRQAIETTGFVPNALAGALASRRSKLIAALVPSITNIVYSWMIKAFTEGISGHGYQILLSETGFDPAEEEKLIMTHLSRRPDAILLTGIHHTSEARRMLLAAGIPVVELWDTTESPIDLCVGFSHVEAGRAAADFAVGAGYRNFATVCAGDERATRRRDAFTREVARLCGKTTTAINFEEIARLSHGRDAMRRLIEDEGFRDGVIFCSSDILAHGIIIEANARGLKIPEDVAVIGFGDQEFAAYVEPAITTVRVDRTKLGHTAAAAILARCEGGPSPDRVTDLGFEIIRRKSA
jgi:LacI family transcriptional regulator, gluconate utilization system Gnt-I transcriptional repressor